MADQLSADIRRYYESVVVRIDQTQSIVATQRSNWRRGVLIAVAAAIITALVLGIGLLLQPTESPVVDTTPTTLIGSTETTEAASTTLSEASAALDGLPPAPWSGAKLDPANVDVLLLDAWSQAGNKGYCSLLAPVELGPDGENAVPRLAGFTPHLDWFIAWDNPDGPGMTGSSELCEDCGRSAFGIHGVDLLKDGAEARWSDGSGMTIHPQDGQYADGHQRVLANIVVAGQPCFYQAWSSIGREHLLWFVDQLRFVDGYYSEPIEANVSGDVTVISLGDPPWIAPPLQETDVDLLLLQRWEETSGGGGQCPLLALADLGPGNDQSEIRTARFGGWGVAWDNPEGPGHDGFNEPCSDCGRGVVGLSGGRGSPDSAPQGRPFRAEWEDGSYALYGYEGNLYNQLPPDRIDARDQVTGEPTTPPLHAWLQTADQPTCLYEIWTHLGDDHLHYLFTQLRYVTGYP